MKKYFIFLLILFSCQAAFAETIHLKSGQIINGKIIERTSQYIKIDPGYGVGVTYFIDDIAAIDGKNPILASFQNKLRTIQPKGVLHPLDAKKNEIPASLTDAERIHRILKHLGYPTKAWPVIEKEVLSLLTKIDIHHLRKEAAGVKSDPVKLREFVAKLGGLIEEEGYIKPDPHPLIKLLTRSFVDDDVSQVILTSQIKFTQKVDSIKALVACSAISQLGSIVLDLLDIKARVVFSPDHVFNCILLGHGQFLFADFANQIFKIVDINQYYTNFLSSTWVLKDQYRISPERLLEIKGQLPSELQSDPLEEQLNFLYLYIYISDDYSATPAIFINLGNIYSGKGKYGRAFHFYNKAIEADPEIVEAYHARGITYANKGDIDHAIADLSHAIELFPDFAEDYHDRGHIYSSTGDIDNAILDFNKAIIIDPNYIEAYHERGMMDDKKGEHDQAIVDYSKAIEIDPFFTEAYKSRAEAYFSVGQYDKSWADIHKVEDSGDAVSSDLIGKLKKISQTRILMAALIIAPILILLILRFS